MAHAPQPKPQAAAPKVAPEIIATAAKADSAVLKTIEQNPIYKLIYEGEESFEQRIPRVAAYLMAGIADSTATADELDRRRQQLNEINAAVQVIRKQLGIDQAREITSKIHADVQQIIEQASTDVALFEEQLSPLCELAELFATYGSGGNLVEKINRAKEQKRLREAHLVEWSANHDAKVLAYRRSVSDLTTAIAADTAKLESAWIGKSSIQARIANAKVDLAERERQLAEAVAETPTEFAVPDTDDEIEPVNEQILELQNIGGEQFRSAVTKLREDTEATLAKLSVGFDNAIVALGDSREAFINMDRNCTDATFSLSVLEKGVQMAEAKAREVSQHLIADDQADASDPMADLKRMERAQRSDEVLNYASALSGFLTNIGVGVGSLRKGQAVIKDVLRMNAMALDSLNLHKMTGISNTSDAVTITIGSIIDVCNRGAGRILSDALDHIRRRAEEGSARLSGGTVEAIAQQNEMLANFAETLQHLKEERMEIRGNTVEMLRKQFELIGQMRSRTSELAEATTDSERSIFAARAGVTDKPTEEEPATPVRHGFGLRVPHS